MLLCTVVNCSLLDNIFRHCTDLNMAENPQKEGTIMIACKLLFIMRNNLEQSQCDQRTETEPENGQEESKLESSDDGAHIKKDTAKAENPKVASKDDKGAKSKKKKGNGDKKNESEDEEDFGFPKSLEEFGYTFKGAIYSIVVANEVWYHDVPRVIYIMT